MINSFNKYQMEPPEGGWGHLICLGLAISFIGPFASLPCFGLIFNDFLNEIHADTSDITVVTSTFFCATSFAGLFTNYLFQKYSIRKIGLIGGCLYFVGNFLQIFIKSIWQLLITFSLLQGFAFGFIVPVAFTTFNNYFVRRRVMMMSFAQSLIGIGTMLYPMMVQKLMSTFGFRGCLTILAAISSHSIFGMLIMHPVEWHMKKVIINDDISSESSEVCDVFLKNNHNLKTCNNVKRHSSGNLSNLSIASGKVTNNNNNNLENCKSDHQVSLDQTQTDKWHKIVDFLDLTLLKQPIYVNIVLGISFALYSDIAFFTLQPMYLFELGFTKTDTATIIAIGAAADLSSRVFLALSSAFVTIPSRYVYLAGAFFTIIARFAFLQIFDFKSMVIITGILGFLRSWFYVPIALILSEYLPKERFPSGYGLFMFLQGNIMFAIGPIVGYIRDSTASYPLTFQFLNILMAICVLPWLFEIILIKFLRNSQKPTT